MHAGSNAGGVGVEEGGGVSEAGELGKAQLAGEAPAGDAKHEAVELVHQVHRHQHHQHIECIAASPHGQHGVSRSKARSSTNGVCHPNVQQAPPT